MAILAARVGCHWDSMSVPPYFFAQGHTTSRIPVYNPTWNKNNNNNNNESVGLALLTYTPIKFLLVNAHQWHCGQPTSPTKYSRHNAIISTAAFKPIKSLSDCQMKRMTCYMDRILTENLQQSSPMAQSTRHSRKLSSQSHLVLQV
jgi:hypothetical protein